MVTYHDLCRKYAQEFLDGSGDPSELIYNLNEVSLAKRTDDEWDAPVIKQHAWLLRGQTDSSTK